MTITGEYGAAFLKEQGACRVVPARELSLAEIRKIKEVTGLEIECFIHGAMCYCYSGQCLFSSILGAEVATEDVVPSLVACPIPLENIRRNVIL